MRVITFKEPELAAAAAELQQRIVTCQPDLVVGIARGGAVVASLMFPGVDHVTVTCRRPSTSRKGSLFTRVVHSLPIWVCDVLRMIESRMLARQSNQASPVSMPPEASEAISKANNIVIIDDSVDSGATMLAVRDAVAAIMPPGAKLVTAALTLTNPGAAMRPNALLYDDSTLIRFPWSADFR